MNPIKLSSQLKLPKDITTQAIAVLARRGAGKTYLLSVLMEKFVEHQNRRNVLSIPWDIKKK